MGATNMPKQTKGVFDLDLAQLEKFRGTYKWKAIRCILAIISVGTWIALVVACSLILYLSSPCKAIVEDGVWNSAVVYNIWTPSFQDSNDDGLGDVRGISRRIAYLRKIGVKVVWPDPLLKTDKLNDLVQDFKTIDPVLGTNEDFDYLIKKLHRSNMKIMMNIPISFTSKQHEWFIASSEKDSDLTDLYHWSDENFGKSHSSNFDNRSLYYGHISNNPDAPLLNWGSNKMMALMLDVFTFWIDKGIDGFNLVGPEHMKQSSEGDKSMKEEDSLLPDLVYRIFNHINETFSGRKKIVLFSRIDEATKKLRERLTTNGIEPINFKLNEVVGANEICEIHENISYASCIFNVVSDELQYHEKHHTWPVWELGNSLIPRIATRSLYNARAEMLSIVQAVLPGICSIYYGDEIGMFDLPLEFSENRQYNNYRSQLSVLKVLYNLKGVDITLKQGEISIDILKNDTIMIIRYTREENNITGNVYFVAINFGGSRVDIPVAHISPLEGLKISNGEVVAVNSDNLDHDYQQVIQLLNGSFNLCPECAIVLKFII